MHGSYYFQKREKHMKKISIAMTLITVLFFAGKVLAARVLTPTLLPGGIIVSVETAKALHASARFFDMRKVINYGKGHIPGAVSIPFKPKSKKVVEFDKTKDQLDVSKFPADKNAAVVFYSDGPYGWKSYKASIIAINSGYRNVKWMRSGYGNWKNSGYTVE